MCFYLFPPTFLPFSPPRPLTFFPVVLLYYMPLGYLTCVILHFPGVIFIHLVYISYKILLFANFRPAAWSPLHYFGQSVEFGSLPSFIFVFRPFWYFLLWVIVVFKIWELTACQYCSLFGEGPCPGVLLVHVNAGTRYFLTGELECRVLSPFRL